jgi:hypothetical protein
MRVPECKLLAAMRRAERVVDVENLQLARLHARAELIKQSRRQPRRLGLARCILERWSMRRPACPRLPDSGRLRPSSKDRAAAGRGRWRPHSRKRSAMHAITISNIACRTRSRIAPTSFLPGERNTCSRKSHCRCCRGDPHDAHAGLPSRPRHGRWRRRWRRWRRSRGALRWRWWRRW